MLNLCFGEEGPEIPPPQNNEANAVQPVVESSRDFAASNILLMVQKSGEPVEVGTLLPLTQPVAKRLKLFGITYLVGKIKFKLFFSGSIG